MEEQLEQLKYIAGFYTTAEYSTGTMDDTITVTIHYDTFKHLTEKQLEMLTGLLEQEIKKGSKQTYRDKTMKNITYAKSQTETYEDVDDNSNPTVYSYSLMIEVDETEGFNRENIVALQLILDKATEDYINFKVK